jgi:hypothetical protein
MMSGNNYINYYSHGDVVLKRKNYLITRCKEYINKLSIYIITEVYMREIVLINGIITNSSIGQNKEQDYIEIKLQDGQYIIITGAVNGSLKIGIKIE